MNRRFPAGVATGQMVTDIFEYAKENNYDYFTTTLTISPHKNSKTINDIFNENYDPDGIANKTGTTAPGVERVIKGGQ